MNPINPPTRNDRQVAPQRVTIFSRAKQVVWFLLGILEFLLAFRFFLKLTEANPSAGFTQFIYGTSQPFVDPFLTVFKITEVEGKVFEWTTILAAVVYWAIAMGVLKLISIITPTSAGEI